MADIAPHRMPGLGRRALLRNGLLSGLGVAVASVALPAFTGVARAAMLDVLVTDPYNDPVDFTAQSQWYWCRACTGLFWSGNGADAGDCPALYPGPHNLSGSWMYDVPTLTDSDAGIVQTQHSWNWCFQCQGLFYGPDQASSHCPGNVITPFVTSAPHATGSVNYQLPWGPDWSDASLQAGWYFCSACKGLFHPGSGSSGGVCPIDFKSKHKGSGSFNYVLFVGAT
jgi:hypothetical protein